MAEKVPDSWRLENRLSHPCFLQPSDHRLRVWRYMDLAKFIWLLKEKCLFMSRIDKLVDPYEGSLTAKTIDGINSFLRQHGSKVGWDEMSKLYRQNQATTFVCCWHANEQESEAMWRLYCGQGHGVAIQTTYGSLVHAIETEYEVYVGLVKYIDYEREWFPDANAFHPVTHKRIAFAHEREVRLVSSPSKFRASPPEPAPESLSIPWDTEANIDHIYVDPYAPEYFFEAVRTVLAAISPSLLSRVQWSQMKAVPLL